MLRLTGCLLFTLALVCARAEESAHICEADPGTCLSSGMQNQKEGKFLQARADYAAACRKAETKACHYLQTMHYDWYYLGDKALLRWYHTRHNQTLLANLGAQCNAGDHEACQLEAWSMLKKDRKGATAILEKSCRDGDGPSCVTYVATHSGDRAHQVGLLEIGCRARAPMACVIAADFLRGTEPERSNAMEQAACGFGREVSCARAAMFRKEAGADEKLVLALQRDCDLGDSWACAWLTYELTRSRRFLAAMQAHLRACELGDSSCKEGLEKARQESQALQSGWVMAKYLFYIGLVLVVIAGALTARALLIRKHRVLSDEADFIDPLAKKKEPGLARLP